MSANALSSALDRCREAAVQVAWSQWSVLGGQVGGRPSVPTALVDPEALLLFSCALRDEEPRLWDLVGGFMAGWSSLLSVQRARNLARVFPEPVRAVMAEAAAIALADGKDARWKSLEQAAPRTYRPGKVHEPARRIADPPALLLRLRLAFGVHGRTDALAFLLATAPTAATARDVAAAIAYGPMPVRRALEAIAASRLIVAEGSRPERYHADPERWRSLLDGAALPTWRYWASLFAFLAETVSPAGSARVRERSAYMESSHLRRLVLKHRGALVGNRISIPEPSDYPGEMFLEGFGSTLRSVTDWLGKNV
jgi:hypothetical protein